METGTKGFRSREGNTSTRHHFFAGNFCRPVRAWGFMSRITQGCARPTSFPRAIFFRAFSPFNQSLVPRLFSFFKLHVAVPSLSESCLEDAVAPAQIVGIQSPSCPIVLNRSARECRDSRMEFPPYPTLSHQIPPSPTKSQYKKGCFLRRTLRLISETGETPVLRRFFAEPFGVLGGGVEFHGGFEEFEFAVFGGVGGAAEER